MSFSNIRIRSIYNCKYNFENTSMIVNEISARSILSKSAIFDYVINPYIGCQFNCTYCYARFMKRFTGHREPWGQFVDVKINAPQLLSKEINRKKPGRVWISGVCDPYQPLESQHELTRKCLELLMLHNWPVTLQTKSNLILRDIDLIAGHDNVEAGLTVTTANEKIKIIFEPVAPSIKSRIEALEKLHSSGIRTFAMIAPMLPDAEGLADLLNGKVDYVLIDRMNYWYAKSVYQKHNLEHTLNYEFIDKQSSILAAAFNKQGIECQVVY
jgi:DNA repair photolyase